MVLQRQYQQRHKENIYIAIQGTDDISNKYLVLCKSMQECYVSVEDLITQTNN